KVLWKYYQDLEDYRPGENGPVVNDRRKKGMMWWYHLPLPEEQALHLRPSPKTRSGREIARLLKKYYPMDHQGIVSYQHLINRMGFWMATGSGKSLVLIKLLAVLHGLIRRGQIPAHDMLVLTHRDDLIAQFQAHVDEFNAGGHRPHIRLASLRDYDAVKRGGRSLLARQEMTVFYYRSDNLSDVQKEKLIDFEHYDNDGQWYVFLDEAHKGDREDSKRQHIYSILSRNGFLFNFSATFTDPRDLLTTVYDFNLARFIQAGHGKHILILQQEARAFRDKEDYTHREKRKVVLKALLLLTYAAEMAEQVRAVDDRLYHRPLMLTLVHSVNVRDADLKLFFRELERIGAGQVDAVLLDQARAELWAELRDEPPYLFEGTSYRVQAGLFHNLTLDDVLRRVFHAEQGGQIEILLRPSNRQEIALKLKSSEQPFALIKIGDIAAWLRDELAGYEINQQFDDESFFERLNADDSAINILMGSRTFYEGWDSNRPNVITFINIGVGAQAKKFILQAVGRGVRIEPLPHQRKRLDALRQVQLIDGRLAAQIGKAAHALETLCILGTNRRALQTVLQHLDQAGLQGGWQQISLFVNREAEKRTLLIPVYRSSEQPLVDQRPDLRFAIDAAEFDLLRRYLADLDDPRLLLAIHDLEPGLIPRLRQAVQGNRFRLTGRPFGRLDLLLDQILRFLSAPAPNVQGLKELTDEIRHFRHIQVSLVDLDDLRRRVERVRDYQDAAAQEAALDAQLERGQISLTEYKARLRQIDASPQEERIAYRPGQPLHIRHIAHHYYLPVLLAKEGHRLDYIKHIIQVDSEIRFVNALAQYAANGSRLDDFDWWMFSKLDETLDGVYLPYYASETNRLARFKPDFIFWLQKGDRYWIVFVDPKGTAHASYPPKIDGYCELFETKGQKRRFSYRSWQVEVHLLLYTADKSTTGKYHPYWFETIDEMLDQIG
ncbi:MAG TPA: restriction endonuclease subunit R, partial [Anaerolineae bacterium]|nr:restriction endonuclease subunit R [Anaerolineae bacterium]